MILIPSLGLHRGGAPRRLFLIAPDGATLDDPLQRIIPYFRAWVAADETPRTLCLDTDEEEGEENQCRRFYPDGTEDPHVITNPLEADVDLILTTLSRFQSLFFGAGGVHALPSALPSEQAESPLRRDLFFFDEAHSYQPDAFARFHRLVEFLFAEDADIIVASTTMPPSYQDELTFLEPIYVSDTLPVNPTEVHISLAYLPSADFVSEIESQIPSVISSDSSIIAVLNTAEEAKTLFQNLYYSHPEQIALYHPDQPAEERRQIYARLQEREKLGIPTLLLTTGDALESSDLSAPVLLTPFCPPENLIRRAGRCNRRGEARQGQLVVVGSIPARDSRNVPQQNAYCAALAERSGKPFVADDWKKFV